MIVKNKQIFQILLYFISLTWICYGGESKYRWYNKFILINNIIMKGKHYNYINIFSSYHKREGSIIKYRDDIENIKLDEEPLKYADISFSHLYYLRVRIVNKDVNSINYLFNFYLVNFKYNRKTF